MGAYGSEEGASSGQPPRSADNGRLGRRPEQKPGEVSLEALLGAPANPVSEQGQSEETTQQLIEPLPEIRGKQVSAGVDSFSAMVADMKGAGMQGAAHPVSAPQKAHGAAEKTRVVDGADQKTTAERMAARRHHNLDTVDINKVVEPLGMTLSPDQVQAARLLLKQLRHGRDPISVLTGAAGTGKTTLMRAIIYLVRKVLGRPVGCMAPTGKAAARLRALTGEDTTTIHGRLYGAPTEHGICPDKECRKASEELGLSAGQLKKFDPPLDRWKCPHCQSEFKLGKDDKPYPYDDQGVLMDKPTAFEIELKFPETKPALCSPFEVLICDEASMVSTKVHDDLVKKLPSTARLMYVGDSEQLPPITRDDDADIYDLWGPDFRTPTAQLSQVHRQAAGSPIIQVATKIREGCSPHGIFETPGDLEGRWRCDRRGTLDRAARWLAERRKAGITATLLTYTNKTRKKTNALVRRKTGADTRSLQAGMPIVAGDYTVCCHNQHAAKFYNGEVYGVRSVRWMPPSKKGEVEAKARIFKETLLLVEFEGRKGTWYVPAKAIGGTYRGYRREISRFVRNWKQMRKEWNRRPLSANMTFEEYAVNVVGYLNPQRFLFLDYGECLTVHRSQGSQWEDVGFIWDRSTWGAHRHNYPFWKRLMYTACTRAEKRLAIWVL